MFLEYKSFSFMGFPDSLEKDLHAMECNFLSRPVNDEHHEKNQRVAEFNQDEKQEKEGKNGVKISSLKLQLPEVREDEEGCTCTTPKSVDHKIPQVCPPAPRKPKSVPVPSTNQKGSRRRVLLDLSNEVESMFPPALQADFGKKIKKVRKEI